ncbi:MAG: bifunctional phosphopantothenoylcysteine decarboxylase/phosphopantothenate--cysteine ligase CoaBC [PVC group bacterium]
MKSQKKFVITAGPTREFIDPFRFISNPSSGKMGYALARAAAERGSEVVLISGPVSLDPVPGARLVPVTSAREMRAAVMEHAPSADAVVMAAAVSDYRPARFSPSKLKKVEERISLSLVRNPDILGELGRRKGGAFLAGFSADTENIVDNAREKLKCKGLDLIVANDISAPGSGFGAETNRATVIHRDGRVEEWPMMSKDDLAGRIIDLIGAKIAHWK